MSTANTDTPLEIMVGYNENVISIKLSKNANVYDLKKSIMEVTKVPIHLLKFEEFEEIADDDIPLEALGVDISYLTLKQPPKITPKPVPRDFKVPPSSNNNGPPSRNIAVVPPQAPHLHPPPSSSAQPTTIPSPSPPLQTVGVGGEPQQQPLLKDTNKGPNMGIGRFLDPNHFRTFLDLFQNDTEKFTEMFEEKYGFIHPFFVGGKFSSLCESVCKVDKKLIIVYLFNNNIPSRDFCSLTLAQEQLSEFLAESKIQFWVGQMNKNAEQSFLFQFYVPLSYPFLVVLGYDQSGFAIKEIVNEQLTHIELIDRINALLNKHQVYVQQEVEREIANQLQRIIQEEQDRAFQRSLETDAERERMEKAQRESIETSKTMKLSYLAEARRAALERFAQLPHEPLPPQQGQPSNSIRVMVKLIEGSRIERRFSEKDTLAMVFTFIEGILAQQLSDETYVDHSSPPLDGPTGEIIPFDIKKFELIQTFPKKTFKCDEEAGMTLQQLNLGGGSQAMFFLQRSK